MSITDDQITLSGQLRYQYFDNPGFATISDNNYFAEYDERIGKLIETSFLYAYLDYNCETNYDIHSSPKSEELIKLIQTKKSDPYIDWDAIYKYLDELEKIQWVDIIDDDINDALAIFEPFRTELAGVQNNQQLWI